MEKRYLCGTWRVKQYVKLPLAMLCKSLFCHSTQVGNYRWKMTWCI